MYRIKLCVLVVFYFSSMLFSIAQQTVNGFVIDKNTREKLIGANIYDEINKSGIVTNNYGYFSISIKKNHRLRVSFIGYATKYLSENEINDKTLNIDLVPANELNEVLIIGKKEKQIGSENISIETLKTIPALLGEPDLIRALTYLPGISAGAEGTTGLYVRGGSPDQNLILLDEAPIYNAGHIGGFVSVFNSGAINNIQIYKSAFPARFGGRLSSVLDISMKEGNKNYLNTELNIGLLGTNLLLEGPIKNKKSSFMVAGRYSNLGFLTNILSRKSDISLQSSYSFYDFNGKFNFEISPESQIYFSIFTGTDKIYKNVRSHLAGDLLNANWGNTTSTIRYSHILSPKIFSKALLVYSKFENIQKKDFTQFEEDETTIVSNINYDSKTVVNDISSKIRFDIFPSPNVNIITGIDFTAHNFIPNEVKTNYVVKRDTSDLIPNMISANELGVYIENDIKIGKNSSLNVGLRYASYALSKRKYNNFEPRMALNVDLNNDLQIKAGFSKMNQFIHLLTNNGVGVPNDIWVPATELVKPQNSTQYTLGVYKNIASKNLDLSIEGYFKRLGNIIDYPLGTNFLANLNKRWDQLVEKDGKGRAFGLELSIKKEVGKFTSFLSYTLAKAERRFVNINDNTWYPNRYDRRHNFSIVGNYKISKKWSIASTFIYQTGHAVTLPIATFSDLGYQPKSIYAGRNNQRMPTFHRMDLGFSKKMISKRGHQRITAFGIYNVYNKSNPFSLDLAYNGTNSGSSIDSIVLKQFSLFSFLPYISYTWKLK